MKKILIIEDDEALLQTLRTALELENFEVMSAEDGQEGFKKACGKGADLILLDWVLPSMTGLEICQNLRRKGIETPIIILSGRKKDEVDRVLGLECGADDYLLKPFGTKELVARVKAVLRRTRPGEVELAEFAFGDIRIDFKKQTTHKGKKEIHLTAKEYSLLKLLISYEGDVVSRDAILNTVWGYDKFPTTRTVDTFIHNLRKKIENNPSDPRHLITVPWSGYKFQK
jgi:DNA-binding response OmpR family regulator